MSRLIRSNKSRCVVSSYQRLLPVSLSGKTPRKIQDTSAGRMHILRKQLHAITDKRMFKLAKSTEACSFSISLRFESSAWAYRPLPTQVGLCALGTEALNLANAFRKSKFGCKPTRSKTSQDKLQTSSWKIERG